MMDVLPQKRTPNSEVGEREGWWNVNIVKGSNEFRGKDFFRCNRILDLTRSSMQVSPVWVWTDPEHNSPPIKGFAAHFGQQVGITARHRVIILPC